MKKSNHIWQLHGLVLRVYSSRATRFTDTVYFLCALSSEEHVISVLLTDLFYHFVFSLLAPKNLDPLSLISFHTVIRQAPANPVILLTLHSLCYYKAFALWRHMSRARNKTPLNMFTLFWFLMVTPSSCDLDRLTTRGASTILAFLV